MAVNQPSQPEALHNHLRKVLATRIGAEVPQFVRHLGTRDEAGQPLNTDAHATHGRLRVRDDEILLDCYIAPDGSRHVHTVKIEDFAKHFAEPIAKALTEQRKLSHAELSAIDSAGRLGYKDHFTRMYQDGHLV